MRYISEFSFFTELRIAVLGPDYTKRQRQLYDVANDSVLIENKIAFQ